MSSAVCGPAGEHNGSGRRPSSPPAPEIRRPQKGDLGAKGHAQVQLYDLPSSHEMDLMSYLPLRNSGRTRRLAA